MLKLFRLILALILVLTAGIIAARLIGESQPPGTALLLHVMFTNPDGSACEKPCMFGIHPGIEQQREDAQRLAQFSWMHSVDLTGGDVTGWFDISGQNATFSAPFDSNIAWYLETSDDFVRQQTSFSQPMLGDILATFGVPTLVNWKSNNLTLWYANEKMYIWCDITFLYPDGSISPSLPIDGIIIFSSETDGMGNFKEIGWRGFTNIGRYDNLQ